MSTSSTLNVASRELISGDHVVLINPFEVPDELVDEVERGWLRCADYLRGAPGFIDTQLHRALSTHDATVRKADFAFINVGYWRTKEEYEAAVYSEGFQRLFRDAMPANIKSHPALFEALPKWHISAPKPSQG